jgi:hypothetical protein
VAGGCATAQTGFPSHVKSDRAVVVGKVFSTTAGEVEFWVEYGLTSSYGAQTEPETFAFPANTPTSINHLVTGLQRSTLYHYRFCASDGTQESPGCGEDRTFTTQSFDCGETVTSSVRLTDDYVCLDGPGLVVGAPGIEIDLAGYRMIGGSEFPRIDNGGGFDDVTVRNGGLSNSGDAVYLQGASRNRVLDVTTHAGNGVVIRGGDANEVRRSELRGSRGVVATGATGLVVAGNELNTLFEGIVIVDGDRARIVRNRVESATAPFQYARSIELTQSDDGRIAENVVSATWTFGGIWVNGGFGHQVVDNRVHNVRLVPIGDPASNGDGIHVFQGAGTTVLRRNDVRWNEGDGIDVRAGGTRLEGNGAADNLGVGILAVDGVIDLGANFAERNGGAAQCVNVFCP